MIKLLLINLAVSILQICVLVQYWEKGWDKEKDSGKFSWFLPWGGLMGEIFKVSLYFDCCPVG